MFQVTRSALGYLRLQPFWRCLPNSRTPNEWRVKFFSLLLAGFAATNSLGKAALMGGCLIPAS